MCAKAAAPKPTSKSDVALNTANELFNRIIGPFAATQVYPLLNEPDNIEERVNVLVKEFNTNAKLITPFQKLIKSIQNQENTSIEEQIRFFQTKHARNWLIVNLFNNVLNVKDLKLDPESGRLPAKPHDLLKFSTQAKVGFGEESRYKHVAGAIGLMFDFLFYLQKTSYLNLNGAKFDEFIAQSFKKGIEQGIYITKLSRYKAQLTNEQDAPMTAMIRQLAHICLVLLNPTKGMEFYKKLSTMKYTEPLKLAMEMKEFGLHSGAIAGYIAQSCPLLHPLGEVMSVWGVPHLAHYTKHKDIHDLAAIGELGVVLKENIPMTMFPESDKVGKTLAELKFFDFVLTPAARAALKTEGNT